MRRLGPAVADSVVDVFAEATVETTPALESGHPLAGKAIVLTGSLGRMTRDQATAFAERLRPKASGSISSEAELVVAGPR